MQMFWLKYALSYEKYADKKLGVILENKLSKKNILLCLLQVYL